ncbi:MAG: hypothetical protein IPG07_08780 [Crocinitomicaceae bacterium]|nr:hypothetical protein [Crocinitomicaceae bacterium]
MWNGFGVYDNGWNFGDADAMSGTQFLSAQYNSNSYVWTPEFEVSRVGRCVWRVYVSGAQSSASATMLGDPFVEFGDETTFEYQEEVYCFTPTVDGTYSFGIYVNETGAGILKILMTVCSSIKFICWNR